MNLLNSSTPSSFQHFQSCSRFSPLRSTSRFFSVRSSLPFPAEKAKYHREIEAAIDVVEKACRLCVDVKKSMFSGEGRIIEKNDRTPVTIADFGVQALISLELNRLFPSIPLVAEEDSSFLRSSLSNIDKDKGYASSFLVDSVLNAVTDKASANEKTLTSLDVLEAVDRGGKDGFAFGVKPATYWVLDPIDGTRGFLKGNDALYVVGLALVVEGEIALGVMGCPNWKYDFFPINESDVEGQDGKTGICGAGIIMASHVGCGTWTKWFTALLGSMISAQIHEGWVRCSVDGCSLVHEARFCISDSQTWESLPLSVCGLTTDSEGIKSERKVVLLPICCGSLCKYLMVASGRASVFILGARVQSVIKIWDHAAGMICVQEAGGMVTDWKGSWLDLAADQVGRRAIFPWGGVLVTNGSLHNQILEMISLDPSLV